MKNNKGFTLIELIVVISLMVIIAGVSSRTLGTVSNQELKDFANNYDSMLSQCQIETMSGLPQAQLEIVISDGEYRAILYSGTEVIKSQFLGETHLTCEYDGTKLTTGTKLVVKFDRSTGEITTNPSFKKLSVSNKRGTYNVELVPQTGYHKVTQ